MRLLPFLPLAVLAACAADPDAASCGEVSREILAADAELPGGGTVADLAVLPGDHAGTLTWEGGEQTDLQVTIADLGDVVRVESENVDGTKIACLPLVAAPAKVTFRTADGAFDETAPVKVLLDESGTTFAFDVNVTRVAGTWEPGPGDMEPGETGTLSFLGALAPDGTASGEVFLTAESCQGDACGGHRGPVAAWTY